MASCFVRHLSTASSVHWSLEVVSRTSPWQLADLVYFDLDVKCWAWLPATRRDDARSDDYASNYTPFSIGWNLPSRRHVMMCDWPLARHMAKCLLRDTANESSLVNQTPLDRYKRET